MSYDLIFLLEEPSIENVLKEILPKIIPDEISFICIPHQGKQDLAKSIPKKIRAFQFNPDTKFVIVHDQDSHDCKNLKSELLEICQNAGNKNILIRIICHELESWFLGDLVAVEKAYGLKPESLSQKQNKTKFRNPDQLNSAKEELRKLVPEYYPGTHSRMIAPYLSLTENKSRSFQVFLDGINKIIN
ncbi:DUF4276 family protein [Anabaena sp. FACHB-709]|uniref:DUF4276 domain-containing protein n=2 Tax=Nostocaceae TaxID=1162 RepID=A0A1Z4KRH3_ANAVA|nr:MULTISPECIES: DUF4276 family protein [Nostocaceae]BAY71481.1 hypothetical protein NIES23_42990 [Trichormus variabilis NIES-23]HBW32512.1 DUF4276 domain-containing protein [Nostoc sp. UBA8866]MBD2172155.1 DUF4276 family protein [Anabaena cylindrica FACHB-318]MBD2263657.1 DUF4276 family protein [Anabaena sp. FACHB-709]MBD2274758.1 DUF4276 family protein [Nostoc sp. PCC 7120 = FACHB-418]